MVGFRCRGRGREVEWVVERGVRVGRGGGGLRGVVLRSVYRYIHDTRYIYILLR